MVSRGNQADRWIRGQLQARLKENEGLIQEAINTPTDVTNFDGVLSSADTDVQKALETIDDMRGDVATWTAIQTMDSGQYWAGQLGNASTRSDVYAARVSVAGDSTNLVAIGDAAVASPGTYLLNVASADTYNTLARFARENNGASVHILGGGNLRPTVGFGGATGGPTKAIGVHGATIAINPDSGVLGSTNPYEFRADSLNIRRTTTSISPTTGALVVAGGVGIGGDLYVDGDVSFSGDLRIDSSPPASAGASGTTGTITYDSSYIYVCVATDTWKRAALATW